MNTDVKDKERGLYGKFRVERTDGRSASGEKHAKCDYFVLDLSHDPFAYKALAAYARACATEYPALADDLIQKMNQMGEWMVEKQFSEMSPREREDWRAFVHNDPERR
jgi:hypothetical protein